MNPALMNFIEHLLRGNVKFTITSAYRTKEENDACGGSPSSQHLTGDAIDIRPNELTIDEFIKLIKVSGFGFDQLIRYRSFVHISFPRYREPRLMELNFTDRK